MWTAGSVLQALWASHCGQTRQARAVCASVVRVLAVRRALLMPQCCRLLPLLQTYCRIHQTIDIKLLAERLNMGLEAAEKWITNLILNARLNAKIDAKSGTVVMGTQSESVHEQLVEKSKQLSVRTFMLANTVVGTAR